MGRRKVDVEVTCQYFALCTRPAVHAVELRAIQRVVPMCQRCADKYVKLGGKRSELRPLDYYQWEKQ